MLAIVVVGIALFGAVRVRARSDRQPGFDARPALAVVTIGALVVVAALTVTTARTVQLSERLDAATDVASGWASRYDERVLDARFDGTGLVLVIEGTSHGDQDAELLPLLEGEVPAGTAVIVNRIPGSRDEVGAVPSG